MKLWFFTHISVTFKFVCLSNLHTGTLETENAVCHVCTRGENVGSVSIPLVIVIASG